ncbi:MAG TPA: hypothetical protein VMT45_11295 [Thermoanaerobaculaceae bacterium]|nr:hypothetical protein [Thermoanaerobaculaceae bacterium]
MAPQTTPDLKHAQRALQGFLERLRFTLVALVVSTFPESTKRTGWPSVYASGAAHAFGGWVEALVSAGLFGVGFLNYVTRFLQGPGGTFLLRKPGSLTYGDLFGTGALGYVSYLFTPAAWVTLFCFVEGILRALDAAFSERMLGMAFVALPWRASLAVTRAAGRKRHQALLGPERPDEVVTGKSGEEVALTIFAAREKPWADNQVIEHEGDFYEVIGKRLVERGGHRAYRYDFRHLDHGEVIRGVLVPYEPSRQGKPGMGRKP